MAVTCTNLTSNFDEDGGSSSTTASITIPAFTLCLLTVASRTGITANPNIPTATSTGATWVAVDSQLYDSTSSSRRRVSVLRTMVGSNQTGAITIDFSGQAQTDVLWIVEYLSGVDTSGTNGSGAIVQTAKNADESGTLTTLTATLGAFGSPNNATYGLQGWSGNPTATAGTGFTLTDEQHDSVSDIGCATEFRNDNDTTVNFTLSAADFIGIIGIEIKAASTTNIKTIIGLAKASVKTVNGLAIASLKTWNGLT